MDEELLWDTELVLDPDESQEMGAQAPPLIAEQDLRGCRLLLVRRAVEPFKTDSMRGLAVELQCTFQPAFNSRFSWAQILLKISKPDDARFLDVGPEAVREGEPVRFTLDNKGKLGLKYAPFTADAEATGKQEFSVYHCDVKGSGAATRTARWDFRENPHTLHGLGQSQSLTFLLSESTRYALEASVSARIVRFGFNGVVEAATGLIGLDDTRMYPLRLDFPPVQQSGVARFLFGS